jgi:hypothetical protein
MTRADDNYRAYLNHFNIEAAAQRAVMVLNSSVEKSLERDPEMDASAMSETVSFALLEYFRNHFKEGAMREQAVATYDFDPVDNLGGEIANPQWRIRSLRGRTFTRMTQLPEFKEALVRAFCAAGMKVDRQKLLVSEVCDTLRDSAQDGDTPALGPVIKARLTAGWWPVMKPEKTTLHEIAAQ